MSEFESSYANATRYWRIRAETAEAKLTAIERGKILPLPGDSQWCATCGHHEGQHHGGCAAKITGPDRCDCPVFVPSPEPEKT